MKKLIAFITVLGWFSFVGIAAAIPRIDFDVAGAPDSSVSLNFTTFLSSINASLVGGMDGTTFRLSDGQSYTFDFFTITVDSRLIGGGRGSVTAVLAFQKPSGTSGTGYGDGGYGTAFGWFSGGLLTWVTQPATVVLASGDSFDISFSNICELGVGNVATVQATVTAHVAAAPEPTTLLLLGAGLIGLAAIRSRKLSNS